MFWDLWRWSISVRQEKLNCFLYISWASVSWKWYTFSYLYTLSVYSNSPQNQSGTGPARCGPRAHHCSMYLRCESYMTPDRMRKCAPFSPPLLCFINKQPGPREGDAVHLNHHAWIGRTYTLAKLILRLHSGTSYKYLIISISASLWRGGGGKGNGVYRVEDLRVLCVFRVIKTFDDVWLISCLLSNMSNISSFLLWYDASNYSLFFCFYCVSSSLTLSMVAIK